MDARTYLKRAVDLRERIRNKTLEMEQWESIATKTSVSGDGERVQASANMHKLEDAVIKIVEIENQIGEIRMKYIDELQEIVETIDLIKDTDSYSLLHLKYIQGKTMEEIKEKKNFSQTTYDRKIEKAHKLVQNILDEREKNGK